MQSGVSGVIVLIVSHNVKYMLKKISTLENLILAHITVLSGYQAGNSTLGEVDEAGEAIVAFYKKAVDQARQRGAQEGVEKERERCYEMFDYSDDQDYQNELTDKQDAREKAIKKRETVYLSEHGSVITEDEYLEFMEHCDCVIPADVGSQRAKYIKINLKTLQPEPLFGK